MAPPSISKQGKASGAAFLQTGNRRNGYLPHTFAKHVTVVTCRSGNPLQPRLLWRHYVEHRHQYRVLMAARAPQATTAMGHAAGDIASLQVAISGIADSREKGDSEEPPNSKARYVTLALLRIAPTRYPQKGSARRITRTQAGAKEAANNPGRRRSTAPGDQPWRPAVRPAGTMKSYLGVLC